MKTSNFPASSIGRLCRAIGGAAIALASPLAIAAVVDSGDVTIPVPATTDGIYLNLVTGVSATTPAAVPGWDFNPFSSTNLAFFPATGSATVGAGGIATALNSGDVVGPSSTFTTGNAGTTGTAFRTTTTAIVGFRFLNEATGVTNFGFAVMDTTAPGGVPATIRRYVYENTGASLTVVANLGLFRSYLDPSGSDANPCTLPAPCRLLPAALAAVRTGGEVWMLESANYNTSTVTVSKSVSILAVPGVVGSLVAAGGPALVVDNPSANVVLRNLMIVPLSGGGGTHGINVTAAAKITIEQCLVSNLPGTGILIQAPASVWVTDSTIRNNNDGMLLQSGSRTTVTRTRISGNANRGIFVSGIAGTTTVADIADSTVSGNASGIFVESTNSGILRVAVRDSQITGNQYYGLLASSATGLATLSASNNVVSNNAVGIQASNAVARVWASGNTVSNNNVGLQNFSALFESAGDNAVDNNTTPFSGTITPVVGK